MEEMQPSEGAEKSIEDIGEISKFKSGAELLKAYQNLERRFTQKCQELSETRKTQGDLNAREVFRDELKLEDTYPDRAVDGESGYNREACDAPVITDTVDMPESAAEEVIPDKSNINDTNNIKQEVVKSGAVSPADAVKADAEKLLSLFPDAAEYIESIGDSIVRNSAADFAGMVRAYTDAKVQSGIQALKNDQSFLDTLYTGAEFQRRYIEDIKKSIRNSPPIMREKGSYIVNPPQTPKNLEEAGKLAIAMLSKKM